MMTDDERREHRRQLLAREEAKREAAWEKYRDTIPMIFEEFEHPDRHDVRRAFEAGYDAGQRDAGEDRRGR